MLTRRDVDKIVDDYNNCIEASTRQRYASTPKASAVVAVSSSKSAALDALQKKVLQLPDFENKQNSLDLIADIQSKVTKGQTVPPYLIEGLKGYLGTNDQVKDELTQVLNTLNGH